MLLFGVVLSTTLGYYLHFITLMDNNEAPHPGKSETQYRAFIYLGVSFIYSTKKLCGVCRQVSSGRRRAMHIT